MTRKTASILAIVVLLIAGVVGVYNCQMRPPLVVIYNNSNNEMRFITLEGNGFKNNLENIKSNNRKYMRVSPKGESSIKVTANTGDQTVSLEAGYIEQRGYGFINIFELNKHNELTYNSKKCIWFCY